METVTLEDQNLFASFKVKTLIKVTDTTTRMDIKINIFFIKVRVLVFLILYIGNCTIDDCFSPISQLHSGHDEWQLCTLTLQFAHFFIYHPPSH